MGIRVISMDLDDCLIRAKELEEYPLEIVFSDDESQSDTESMEDVSINNDTDIIKDNKTFLSAIKSENTKFDQTILCLGSNRQSKKYDDINKLSSHQKLSCCPAMVNINNFLGTQLDQFLLADIYGNLPSGTSFNRILRALEEEELAEELSFSSTEHSDHVFDDPNPSTEHSDYIFDDTKLTIMYAQMHKMANEHLPHECITFDFYDDSDRILNALKKFFTQYPEMIPDKVTLRLHQYNGGAVISMATISGTGFADANYRQTVLQMARISSLNNNGKIDAVGHVTPECLKNIRRARNKHIQSSHFETWLKFEVLLAEILRKSEAHAQCGHSTAAEVATGLHSVLQAQYEKFKQGKIMQPDFKRDCDEAIDRARPELEKHRGWKQILGNLALVLVGFGIGYLIAGLVNQYVTGHFLFFSKTDSADKIDGMRAVLEKADALPLSM